MEKRTGEEALPRPSPDQKAPPSLAELARTLPAAILATEAFQLSQQIAAWDLREAFNAESVYLFNQEAEGAFTLQAQAGPPPCEEVLPRLTQVYNADEKPRSGQITWESTSADGQHHTTTMFYAQLGVANDYKPILCVVREALTTEELARLRYLAAIIAPALGSSLRQERLANDLAEARRLVHDTKAEQRAKNAFLARMSHDLRTPLSVILGFAQLLEMEPLDKQYRVHVQHILHSGRQLKALINQVLELTSIDSGKLTLQLQPVHVSKKIAKCLTPLLPQAREKQLKVSIIDPEGEAPWVLADTDRFEQILLNLFSNAIKFNSKKGSITISYYAAESNSVRIEVRDTGPGVPKNQIPRLFEPFDRLGASQEIEGAGLGLALSRVLTQALGGRLTVESHLGRGSTFILEMPAATKPEEQNQADANPTSD